MLISCEEYTSSIHQSFEKLKRFNSRSFARGVTIMYVFITPHTRHICFTSFISQCSMACNVRGWSLTWLAREVYVQAQLSRLQWGKWMKIVNIYLEVNLMGLSYLAVYLTLPHMTKKRKICRHCNPETEWTASVCSLQYKPHHDCWWERISFYKDIIENFDDNNCKWWVFKEHIFLSCELFEIKLFLYFLSHVN